MPWERRRPRRHTVQSRPRRTGCTAFCRMVEPVYSSPPARTSAPHLNFSRPGFLCLPRAGVDSVGRVAGSGFLRAGDSLRHQLVDRVDRVHEMDKMNDVPRQRCRFRILVSPAGGGGREAVGGGLCGRVAALWKSVPAAALKKGRHRGLPLRAAEISRRGRPPDSPCVAETWINLSSPARLRSGM